MANGQGVLYREGVVDDRTDLQKGFGCDKCGKRLLGAIRQTFSNVSLRLRLRVRLRFYSMLRYFQWFREEVSREAELEGETAVGLIELLADAHGPCLQEMEARLARWEGNTRHNIGDFLYNTLLNVLPLYDQYLENLIPALEKMEYSMRSSRRFDQLCRDFEAQKHCYLPLSSFLLKPLQRLLHYNSIIDRKYHS